MQLLVILQLEATHVKPTVMSKGVLATIKGGQSLVIQRELKEESHYMYNEGQTLEPSLLTQLWRAGHVLFWMPHGGPTVVRCHH